MNGSVSYRYADIAIRPTGTLAETAALVGRALGDLQFQEDSNHVFDEYPAFIAQSEGLRFALLGIPSAEDDIRDEPSDDFTLLVNSVDAWSGAPREDISSALLEKLTVGGRLVAWRLE